MKKFLFILSILFCITAFANNSFADCPAITPSTTYEGIPVKEDPRSDLYLVAQPFEYNGECVAWGFWFGQSQSFVDLISNYPTGSDIDFENAHYSQILEICSESEAYQILSDPTVYTTLLNQSYGESVNFMQIENRLDLLVYIRGRCPITCEAGKVLEMSGTGIAGCSICPSAQCCLTEQTTYTLSDYRDVNGYLCPVSGGGSAPARLRVSTLTPDNADGTIIASGAYAKGAYNANVGNINTALTYVEDSSVETIKHATVSAENVSLSVAGFTPAGTIDVDSSNATVSGTVNVANTVAMLSEWGTNSTENGTLSGSQQVSITNGAVTGMTGSFSGPASGQLSGTGSLSNASVHVNNWVPVNPS